MEGEGHEGGQGGSLRAYRWSGSSHLPRGNLRVNVEEVCVWTVYLDLDRSLQGEEVSSYVIQGKEVSFCVLQVVEASFYVCQAGETSCVDHEVFHRGLSSHTDSVDGTSLSQEIQLKLLAFYA